MKLVMIAVCLLTTLSYAEDSMLSKARNIQLPTVTYREVALRDILEDIRVKSAELDPQTNGVNFFISLDERDLNKKLTMTVGNPTIERLLNLLAASSALYIRYDANIINIEKSGRAIEGQKK